jgi:L-ascorbate peroxidase
VHEYYFQHFLEKDADANAGKKDELKACETAVRELVNNLNCGPILVRLAWHDSGTYDQRIQGFPACGGANGAIRFEPELSFGANAGLDKAKRYMEEIQKKHPSVSWADLIQMGSAIAIEACGGPKIPMKYGRVSAKGPEDCVGSTSREGFAGNAGLPDPMAGGDGKFPCGASDPATHLRNVFSKKMGFNDQEIVALSGAHTIGRAFKERSGTCPFGYTDAGASKYTQSSCIARKDGAPGVGMSGGGAWTKNWLTFDNSYFTQAKEAAADDQLLSYPTDQILFQDAGFKPTFDKYAADQNAFFADYAKAHKKLSELGCKFDPPEGFTL